MTQLIHRHTLFKVMVLEDQEKLLEAYRVLAKKQAKDGKPYILHVHAAPILLDARANGYTILARTTFANFEDMVYFDRDCPAHMEFKKTVKEFVREKPLMAVVKEEVAKETALELI